MMLDFNSIIISQNEEVFVHRYLEYVQTVVFEHYPHERCQSAADILKEMEEILPLNKLGWKLKSCVQRIIEGIKEDMVLYPED